MHACIQTDKQTDIHTYIPTIALVDLNFRDVQLTELSNAAFQNLGSPSWFSRHPSAPNGALPFLGGGIAKSVKCPARSSQALGLETSHTGVALVLIDSVRFFAGAHGFT